jgi:hypothetical protein
MTVTAQGHSPQRLTTLRIGCQPGSSSPPVPGAYRRGAVPRYPAGPGLSAVDMAAAALCLADTVWNAGAIRPVAVDPSAGRLPGSCVVRFRAGKPRLLPAACAAGHRPFPAPRSCRRIGRPDVRSARAR